MKRRRNKLALGRPIFEQLENYLLLSDITLSYHSTTIQGAFTTYQSSGYPTAVKYDLPDSNLYEVKSIGIMSAGKAATFPENTQIVIRIWDASGSPLYTSNVFDFSGQSAAVGLRTLYIDTAHVQVSGSFYGGFQLVSGAPMEFGFKVDVPSGNQYKHSYTYKISTGTWSTYSSDDLWFDATVGVVATNQAPTDIALSNSSVAENQAVGTAVGTLSTVDPDAGNTFTYSLVSGTGDTDNASFSISGGTLQTAASFNYEVKNSYSIRLRATDQGGLYFEKAFTIAVTDVNETPVYNGSANNDSVRLSFINNQFAITDLSGNILNAYNGSSLKIDLAAGADTLVLDASILGKTLALSLSNTENIQILCNASSNLALTLSSLNLNSISASYTGSPTFTLANPTLNSLSLTGAISLQLATPNLIINTGNAQTLRQYLANGAAGAKPALIPSTPSTTLALLDNSKLHKTSFAGITLAAPFSQFLIQSATPGDANLDGVVNQKDLLAIYANLNKSNATWIEGDLNQDGTVNLTDLALVQSHLAPAYSLKLQSTPKSPARVKTVKTHKPHKTNKMAK